MADVLIAGGGVAGSSLAIMLGRAGLAVELFERGHFPREKPCGEGLMPAGVAVLDRLGLADAVGGTPFHGIRYYAGSVVAEAPFPAVRGCPSIGRAQRRLVLDRILFAAAAATPGVVVHAGVAVQAPLVEGSQVRGLIVDGARRLAPLIVVADGLHSSLRRQLGLEGSPPRRVRVGIRTHFRPADGHARPPWVEVFVGQGYELYVTSLPNDELLVAALAEADQLRDGADASLARWIAEQPPLGARLEGAERISAFLGRAPLASPARGGVAPGAVLLGDAAGYLDPITGGGMAQALLTAELLAAYAPRIIAEGDVWLGRFDRERCALLRDYELLTRGVVALSAHPRLARLAVRLLRASPGVFSHLVGVAGGVRPLLPALGSPMATCTRRVSSRRGVTAAAP
jgi:menaquinone-9 beta-reductase